MIYDKDVSRFFSFFDIFLYQARQAGKYHQKKGGKNPTVNTFR